MSNFSRFKSRICKPVARKKLHIFCDEQSYADNLTRLYIYNELNGKNRNEKGAYRENINKYVGKVSAHLNINKGNGNIIFSVPTFLDIFFFNYFKFNHKAKLVFLYSVLNIKTQEKALLHLKQEQNEKKKKKILTHLCEILLNFDTNYVQEIRLKYINKFYQSNDRENKGLTNQQQKVNYHHHAIIPLSNRKTFIQHIVNQTQNLKDLSILICIIRKASSFHTFECSKILDALLRKVYSHINNFSVTLKPNYACSLRNSEFLSLIDKSKIEQTKTVKIRDLLYSFYQLVYLQPGQKIQFIFLKILAILGNNCAQLGKDDQGVWGEAANETNANEANTNPANTNPANTNRANANPANANPANTNPATTHSPAHNLFLSNKDIEQLFFLLTKNLHLNGYFMHPLVMLFYVKLFGLTPTITYFKKLIKKNDRASCSFCPISMFPESSQTYLNFLKKTDVQNYFHTFYQTVCIKYLLKRKINFCEHVNNFDHSVCTGMIHSPRLSHFVFYQRIVNKIIARSFYLYQAKINPKGKYAHKWIHTITSSARQKYINNYIYDFTNCKFFYLIYIRAIIRGRRAGKIVGKFAPRGLRGKEAAQNLSTLAVS
ncbi:conserved Plasmodium protein, unknown function [Plasmodium knowlesi strain H]|uniref:Uncharacterized protein n=3 Tax=Plasmodium knowlesi TaxID=5850 RepID=A0A5K1VN33_PLAKH|nr:conserved Plasmodium protein, unknown function [Plasmodium knowlesi strain H]OTN66486.1 Uncharacterized protein PKNOH_S09550200 [Plasmodium knowlesi]CAA9989812.1 conserved Plasmodium protein, unknown function [Plasmodium knowlesi strain H]SBO24357.1 conserved Plasmodium protein, unknown function [Plasmodium knowlesi strain H]SBO26684.1 conserved Plasmodium protein, unknown function [Plasmodium knowlesi strain H]VVS79286.1 conserved Plasmodium protein, unknown function [Plasmodium knowlesi s|eukprot:XP_002259827.1 hypothetical protein, conserved in Plasmodium species [Plasmodium knowlesi strain H]